MSLSVWYLGVRTKQANFKAFAVAIVIIPIIAIGLNLGHEYLGWFADPPFSTSTPGPALGEASVTQEVPVPVTDIGVKHRIELTPIAKIAMTPNSKLEQTAAGTVELSVALRSPSGELLFEDRKALAPYGGKKWNSFLKDFQPKATGNYSLRIAIPQPVHYVDVVLRELP